MPFETENKASDFKFIFNYYLISVGIDAIRQNLFHFWKPFWLCGSGLINKTIGILGFGRVG